ncbi:MULTISPECIES: LysR family transcriptional regulator [Brevibacillus]|jgi:DNA-binding transcriptional LysR family regulator|uniref:LysR family transcriptional regulator n=2 Tax=Brevibacillus borstelensis TaxID=45462 RepID=M8DAR7_9BACL|nr:LysR family transcriptional regulator [Brevibacillus borstelensis]EMT53384.1 LysR family transcriptional regulator [Brevibacillus borstelensis AK1]MBE5394242.1 LysR family transcriptional regulator [Brevibacillus borstelensis]MCC0564244.1 LysR family transcriptional regulator [Brevibacillus borstelensis]MCM3590639.1 LysR family transcriptional regulator [Brevibacillus borstelensis]MED1745434.1 LysR family transcriptional regulator [Brevibacillus borstelensis]
MNIENLEAFVYVVHFNSFNKAADALFLSQPSITARIQSLERELDTKLFHREGRKFTLTEKGRQFLPYAQQILQSYKKGKQQLQTTGAGIKEIRLGCTASVSHYLIPEILPVLRKKYPELQIKLVTGPSEAILQKVTENEIDLGLVRNITHPRIDSVMFYEDPIRLFVYPGHPLWEQDNVTIEEAGNYSLVFFECGSLDWIKLHRLFESLSRLPSIDLYIDNVEAAKKCICKGLGIGFLPESCARREVREKQLCPIAIPALTSLTLRTNVIARKGEGGEIWNTFLSLRKEIDWKSSFHESRLNFSIHE